MTNRQLDKGQFQDGTLLFGRLGLFIEGFVNQNKNMTTVLLLLLVRQYVS